LEGHWTLGRPSAIAGSFQKIWVREKFSVAISEMIFEDLTKNSSAQGSCFVNPS
jgi:hypothetical protein